MKVKSLCYTIFWQTIMQGMFSYIQAGDTGLKNHEYIYIRGLFRTQTKICDGDFSKKIVNSF